MHPMDQYQAQMADLKRQLTEMRTEIAQQNDRLRGILWKMGLLAGIVAMISAEVFGNGIGSIINIILGGF